MNELNEIGEEADADAFNDFSDNMLGPAPGSIQLHNSIVDSIAHQMYNTRCPL